MNYNETALNFIMDSNWSMLPTDVQHQTKRCLMDTMGALIAGHQTPVANLMNAFAEEQFSGNQATILVKGRKTSAAGAALANGFAANALDIDDGYRDVKGHPGACILPVTLTAGEMVKNINGSEFLTAILVGYEIAIRAGLIRHAVYPSLPRNDFRKSFHPKLSLRSKSSWQAERYSHLAQFQQNGIHTIHPQRTRNWKRSFCGWYLRY